MKNHFTLSAMLILLTGIGINAQERAVNSGFTKKPWKSIDAHVPGASHSRANTVKQNVPKGDIIASYDFETGMPEGFNLIDGDCGWAVSDNGGSSYFGIPEHSGQYAYVNDDECNGDMSNVWMVLPRVDLSGYATASITYDQFNSAYDVLTVKVSKDSISWTDYPSSRGGIEWITSQISLADFAGEDTVYIAFHYNDQGQWSYGWAVDNIVIETPFEHDLMVADLFPYGGIAGRTVTPKVAVTNSGSSVETEWSVTLTDSAGYTSTKSGSELALGKTVIVEMDSRVLTEGEIKLTAEVTFAEDNLQENNSMQKTVSVVGEYSSDAYAGDIARSVYSKFNIPDGELTAGAGTISSVNFPIADEYDGNYIYRLLADMTVGYVYPDATFEPLGKLTGFEGSAYATNMAYDWESETFYAAGSDFALYSFSMDNLEVTKTANTSLSQTLIAMDFAHDGYLYGPSFDGYLYKINPADGTATKIGETGLSLENEQDVSFDYEHLRLYSFPCGKAATDFRYGFYDIVTGEFTGLRDPQVKQITPVVILKEPQPGYTLTMTVTDGTDPIEGAEVVITCNEMSTTTDYVTDADGKLIRSFTDGAYDYTITLLGYQSKSGSFTVNGNSVTVNETLTLKASHTVTFNITNINGTKLDATVFMKYQGNDMYQGTAINGKIVFDDVFEYAYTYSVEHEGYETVSDVELNVTETTTVDVTMTEIMHHAPVLTDVTVSGFSATLNWFSYPTEPVPVKYFDEESYELTCFLQTENSGGYGVIFDLTEHPYALLAGMEFMHGNYFGMTSPVMDYILHVVDVENKQEIYTSSTLQTTNFMIFENVSIGEIDGYGGKKVGVFIEPKTVNHMGFAHPLIQADNVKTADHHSYRLNLTTLETELLLTASGTFSEFYVVLNILTQSGEKVKLGGAKAMQHYEVLLDDVSQVTTDNESYTITELENGTYTAGVRSVYETGTTATSLKEFTVNSAGIESVQSLLTCYVDNNGWLNVKAGAQTVVLNVYSMSGQLVKNSSTNSVQLPQRGIYAVKALIDGKPVNFKVIW